MRSSLQLNGRVYNWKVEFTTGSGSSSAKRPSLQPPTIYRETFDACIVLIPLSVATLFWILYGCKFDRVQSVLWHRSKFYF